MTRVLVAANSAVERAGLASMVESAPGLELVGRASGGTDLAHQIPSLRPEVVLQQSDPEEEELRQSAGPDPGGPVRVLLLDESQFARAARLVGAADSGVRALLPRWATPEEIVAAVEAAASGLVVLHPEVVEHLGPALGSGSRDLSRPPLQALSARETEILRMLAEGLGNKEIAWRLHISEHTVKFHIGSIFNKLDASSRAEAVALGIRQGLIAL